MSWFGGWSRLFLPGVVLSSIFLHGAEEEDVEDEEELCPDGLLRLLFIPADRTRMLKTRTE